jgi:hypothetical protein
MSAAGENQIKGLALRNFVPVVESLLGDAAAKAVLAELPAPLRTAIETNEWIASAWYPLAWYREMHHVAQRATKSGPSLARRIGHESTRRDLTGVYRIFLSILQPQTLLNASSRVFGRYYAKGKMTVPEHRQGFARVRLDGCEGFDRNVFEDVIGGSMAGLEIAGAKNLRVHVVSGGTEGYTNLEVEARWT